MALQRGRRADAARPMNIHMVRPQMHFHGDVAEVLRAMESMAMAAAQLPAGVNILLEDPQFHFHGPAAASSVRIGRGHVQQQNHLMGQPAPHTGSAQRQQIQDGAGGIISSSAARPMLPNPPSFDSAFTVPGLDFGFELAQRLAYCERYEDANFRLVVYTQSRRSQQVQSLLRVISLGMSTKRAKHVIFMFDMNVDYKRFKWPARVRLQDVKHDLLRSIIGNGYELCRRKVLKESFTLYLYGIKRHHIPFSPYACLEWVVLVNWADSQTGELSGVSLSDQLVTTARLVLSTVGGMMFRGAL